MALSSQVGQSSPNVYELLLAERQEGLDESCRQAGLFGRVMGRDITAKLQVLYTHHGSLLIIVVVSFITGCVVDTG